MGGKSRKAGGSSKKLLAALRQGRVPDWNAKKTKVTSNPNEKTRTSPLFDQG